MFLQKNKKKYVFTDKHILFFCDGILGPILVE